MAYYIPSHQSTRDHKKTLRLCRLLLVRPREAWGILHGLWWWALTNAKSGLLDDVDPRDIAAACDWGGPYAEEETPERLLNALIESGYVDRKKGSRGRVHLVIHSWHRYAGRVIRVRKNTSNQYPNPRNPNGINGKKPAIEQNRVDKSNTPPLPPQGGLERGNLWKSREPGAGLRSLPRTPGRAELEARRQARKAELDRETRIQLALGKE